VFNAWYPFGGPFKRVTCIDSKRGRAGNESGPKPAVYLYYALNSSQVHRFNPGMDHIKF